MVEESKPSQSPIAEALHILRMFRGADPTQTIRQIEKSVKGVSAEKFSAILSTSGAKAEVLGAAGLVKQSDEGRLISEDGLLQIDWPRCTEGGTAVDLDLLLVTANDPMLTGTPPSYPNVATIVEAWNNADQEHAEYFWKNIDNGITTFQDDEIRRDFARANKRRHDPR